MTRRAGTAADRARLELLLRLVDESYHKRAWHGPNLAGSLRGLAASAAIWRPAPERHNIAEIVLHAAYWKYTVWRRITGAERGSFPLAGSNWFPREAPYDEAAWKRDRGLLARTHRDLRAAIADFCPGNLDDVSPGSRVSYETLIRSIALHDVYHAGQIQTLKRLATGPSPGSPTAG